MHKHDISTQILINENTRHLKKTKEIYQKENISEL